MAGVQCGQDGFVIFFTSDAFSPATALEEIHISHAPLSSGSGIFPCEIKPDSPVSHAEIDSLTCLKTIT
jgi:hypothetical protein